MRMIDFGLKSRFITDEFESCGFNAMSHGAFFLAIRNAILLLANTRLHYILLIYSSHIKQCSLINIS